MVSTANLYEDVRYLTEEIGIRLAGSLQELAAARYLQDRFLQYVPKCSLEEFPVHVRDVKSETLSVLLDGQWVAYPATLFGGASTTGGKTLEAELVFFDAYADYQRPDLSYLKGKAVIHYGLRFGCRENYRRLMEADPAFLLMVDTRYTADGPLGDGLFPAYGAEYGTVPTMNLGFYHAWDICTKKATKARLQVSGQTVPGLSHNVVAELPGTLSDAPCFYFGAHMDTQSGTVGADDNAIGCAVLLEMARILSQKPLRHTLRFLAFGAEEQLSVGSAAYVRRHRAEIEARGQFMVNFDSCGSAVGWNQFVIDANKDLQAQIAVSFNRHDIYYQTSLEPCPFLDQFPFTAAGVPAFTVHRLNCDAGVFYHHQPANDISVIGFDTVAKIAECTAELILKLDSADFDGKLTTNPDIADAVQAEWEENFGGWG